MTVFAKIENNELITAYNGYNGIIGLADSPELCLENGFSAYDEEIISKYFAQQAKIQDGNLIDITDTEEYKAKIAKEKETKFFDNFIGISIGYLRKMPKGYSSIVEAMNSALNVVYINGSLPAGALTIYPKPDFKTIDDIEKYLEENSYKNKEMKSEEFGKLYVEFMTAWNNQEHV